MKGVIFWIVLVVVLAGIAFFVFKGCNKPEVKETADDVRDAFTGANAIYQGEHTKERLREIDQKSRDKEKELEEVFGDNP